MATENGPPPVPSDAIINSNESNINPENNNNSDNDDTEMDYTNIQIPAAIPTESIRDLMYDNDNQNENEYSNENISDNDNISTPPEQPLLEDQQLPHNATTHNAVLDLNFDTQTNEIIFNVIDEITNKIWYMRLNANDFDNPIRDEYNTIGNTISTGTCVYKYPLNNSIDPITVTITNNDNEYTYTIPDKRAQNIHTNDTNNDINDTKTPEIQPPEPPKPPAFSQIKVENIDHNSSDSEPPPPANHMSDTSLFFEDAPEQIHIAVGSIPKSPSKSASPKPMEGLDGIVMTGDIKYENNRNNNEILQGSSPIPMSGNLFSITTDNKSTEMSIIEVGNNIEIIGDDTNQQRGTILDINNEAAKTFVSSREKEKQKEEELNAQAEESKDIPIHWYTSYIYKNELKPWWMSIDVFDNISTNNETDVAVFDDQLPKNAVTTQHNLLQKQMFHLKQQEMIKDKSRDNESEDENENKSENESDIENDPLRRKQIDINKLGTVGTPSTPGVNDIKSKYDLKDKETNVSKNLIIQNELMIDFNVIIRKFMVYTCVWFELTLLMLIFCGIYGFYKWKGYVINLVCLMLFSIGMFVGFKSEKKWTFTNRLYFISYYWLLCVCVIFIVFIVSMIYIISLTYALNDNSAMFLIIFTACVIYIIWFILVLFYIDLISRTIIICGKFYDLWSQLRGIKYFIHKNCYMFTKIFGKFRNCMGRNTGIRFDDLIHFTCCCIYFKRQQTNIITINENSNDSTIEINTEWEPVLNDLALKFRKKHKICRGCKFNCCNDKDNHGHERRSSYDLTGGELIDITHICSCCKCMYCCKSYAICSQECTKGIGLCCSSFCGRFTNITCCGCLKQNVISHEAYDNIENNNCNDCNIGKIKCNCYWLCDGQSAIYIYLFIIIGIFLLLPFVLFGIIVVPFWLIAQVIVFKFINSKSQFFIVVIVFIISLIPPFILWFLLFDIICDSNSSNDIKVMCYLWSVVNTIYE